MQMNQVTLDKIVDVVIANVSGDIVAALKAEPTLDTLDADLLVKILKDEREIPDPVSFKLNPQSPVMVKVSRNLAAMTRDEILNLTRRYIVTHH